MDVVYLCRNGENEELRYSLRGLANLAHGRVFIFGGAPGWVSGVTVVPTPQTGSKYANAEGSLRAAVEHPDVSEAFVLMNDDFYIVEPTDLPTLHRGPVAELLAFHEREYPYARYTGVMRDTLDVLGRLGIVDPLSYELHTPFVFERAKLREVLAICDGHPRPLQYRTIYGNLFGIGGEQSDDVKVYGQERIPRGPFLSTDDRSFRHVRPVLDYLLDPCEYECGQERSGEAVVTDVRLYDVAEQGRFLAYPVGALVPVEEYERLTGGRRVHV